MALTDYVGPVYVRMGRSAVSDVYTKNDVPFDIGKANTIMEGTNITIVGTGETVKIAFEAGILLKEKDISARIIDMHTIKPLDKEVITKAAKETGHIITIEEHSIYGGLGAAVSEIVVQSFPVPMRIIGIPDEPAITGTSPEVFKHYGLTADNLVNIAVKMIDYLKKDEYKKRL
ncbi:MAG: transketolase family protein, partial [Candidatus Atribacteria bacterium]|nr:transketolase family protein [Candidatus Atribacteria bacterium]